MTIYYVSDMHFGSKTMTKYDLFDLIKYNKESASGIHARIFRDSTTRDETIIEQWNSKVTNHDTVYILGDAFNCCEHDARRIFKRLNGNKHLITGNHDKKWLRDIVASGKYSFTGEAKPYEKIKDEDRTVVLSHYPITFWDGQHDGSYHVYGHLHGTHEEKLMREIAESIIRSGDLPEYRAFNAGVMLHNYAPTSLDEMIAASMIDPHLSKSAFTKDTRPWIINGEDKLNEIVDSAVSKGVIRIVNETYTNEVNNVNHELYRREQMENENKVETAEQTQEQESTETTIEQEKQTEARTYPESETEQAIRNAARKASSAAGSVLEEHGIDTGKLAGALKNDAKAAGNAILAGIGKLGDAIKSAYDEAKQEAERQEETRKQNAERFAVSGKQENEAPAPSQQQAETNEQSHYKPEHSEHDTATVDWQSETEPSEAPDDHASGAER